MPHFRLLMEFADNTHQIWSFYGETVLMIILDSNANSELSAWNPPAIGELVHKVRGDLGLPQRQSSKLNRALPIRQGVGQDRRPKECVHCKATPGTLRLAIRIQAQLNKKHSWWFSAQVDKPFDEFYCRLCYHYSTWNGGSFPSAATIANWDEVKVVYFQAAPPDVDRSICEYCKTKATERRNKWCGPLQAILCDTCIEEHRTEIDERVNEERTRRNLPAMEEIKCANCKAATETSNRRWIDGVAYCKPCGIYQAQKGEMKLLDGTKRPYARRVFRPKDWPPATECGNCHKKTGTFRWTGTLFKDLCDSCREKHKRGTLKP